MSVGRTHFVRWVGLLTACCLPTVISAHASTLSPVGACDYVIGIQTIGAAYQFTSEPLLVETANAIREMGSIIIKFQLSNWRHDPRLKTLVSIASCDPATKAVFDMPFADYMLWTYANGNKDDPCLPEKLPAEYQQIHDLTKHLLTQYRGTAKTFYLGNWEGE